MLTKEVCEKALDEMWFGKLNGYHTLKQLIKEHFESRIESTLSRDNPPLKFEELKVGMWVWDNKRKCYGQVTSDKCCALLGTRLELWGIYEENRFYRYEVKENDE
jgi:hypothetical protein